MTDVTVTGVEPVEPDMNALLLESKDKEIAEVRRRLVDAQEGLVTYRIKYDDLVQHLRETLAEYVVDDYLTLKVAEQLMDRLDLPGISREWLVTFSLHPESVYVEFDEQGWQGTVTIDLAPVTGTIRVTALTDEAAAEIVASMDYDEILRDADSIDEVETSDVAVDEVSFSGDAGDLTYADMTVDSITSD